jgi:hypothetical protein
MPGLAKAVLQELNAELTDVKSDGKRVRVQFNPESLKVTFANQIQTPSGAGSQSSGSAGRQYVGAGTTKLALALWFDATSPAENGDRVDDVRRLSAEVVYFMTPQSVPNDATKFVPPGVRFLWGSFKFDGIVESLEETLDFFSPEGKPLRAQIALALSQQKILRAEFAGDGRVPGGGAPGTRPLSPATAGGTLQGMADAAGAGANWQAIAAANGIDNPRRLEPGQLIDLAARAVTGR